VGPDPRRGYSYWAEGSYPYLEELLVAMRRDLALSDRQMTFFVAHAELDADHFTDVEKIIARTCTESDLQQNLVSVLKTTLYLTGSILHAVHERWSAATRE
jgi:pyrroloquinoline quinone (PQQ) biosynthesis protein C